MITPSLTYMAEATASAGSPSFGVAYGLYNVAWAVGLLVGPAVGRLLVRAPRIHQALADMGAAVVIVALVLSRVDSGRR